MKLKLFDYFGKGEKKLTLQEIGVKRLVVILLVGILLLIISIPTGKGNKGAIKDDEKNVKLSGKEEKETGDNYKCYLEKNLRTIIEQVDGIDKADVMITLKSSKEEIILKDEPYEKEESENEKVHSNEEKTVIMEDDKGNTHPYVVKEINPEIEGIVAIIQTTDENKEGEIMELIQVLFDVPVHKIKIMKMKNN